MNVMNPVAVTDTLERIYPSQVDRSNMGSRDALALHLQRYRFASRQLHGRHILDIACGCGYGTALMAARHPDKQFLGVDIDPNAIRYARERYKAVNLEFFCASAMDFTSAMTEESLDRKTFDTIISLETIEHVPEPKAMVSHLLSQLSADGVMIASVPTSPTVDGNPHHLHDFTVKSFYQLFELDGYSPQECYEQVQPWDFSGLFSGRKPEQRNAQIRSQGVALNVIKYYQKNPSALIARVASILTNGLNNCYLSACFVKAATNDVQA